MPAAGRAAKTCPTQRPVDSIHWLQIGRLRQAPSPAALCLAWFLGEERRGHAQNLHRDPEGTARRGAAGRGWGSSAPRRRAGIWAQLPLGRAIPPRRPRPPAGGDAARWADNRELGSWSPPPL